MNYKQTDVKIANMLNWRMASDCRTTTHLLAVAQFERKSLQINGKTFFYITLTVPKNISLSYLKTVIRWQKYIVNFTADWAKTEYGDDVTLRS